MKEYIKVILLALISMHLSVGQTNQPPTIIAEGDQYYCPLSQLNVVTNFNITDPDDTAIESLSIQISEGYVQGVDFLQLNGTHPNIVSTWIPSEGKLILRGVGNTLASYIDLIAAVNDVVFENTSLNITGDKSFSFTIGDANYLPSTDHYYEYIPNVGITWSAARNLAETYTYFGLQGYLVTITSAEEAQLCGEQAAGAGWIGGSDVESEGVWKWMTGPEAGTVFWNGGVNGSSPTFAFWNSNEPNNLGDEDYAHVTAPGIGTPGSWNDLDIDGDPAPSDYHPQGFIVEYGGMPGDPVLNLSASTSITVNEITSTTNGTRCGSGELELEANALAGTILWYDAPTGGNLVGTGSMFTTPALFATTNYYALPSVNGCSDGPREQVTATILEMPQVETNYILQNCDEDGIPDGFTDFNLTEIEEFIIVGDTSNITTTYHLNLADANSGFNEVNPLPFNNIMANTVYARIANSNGCFEISTIDLQVSTTSFPAGFMQELDVCDNDPNNDGFHVFNLLQANQLILDAFPIGQNLTVDYYRNLTDAQLEQNEILPQSEYNNEEPYSQVVYVRVESEDNGQCFGIGPYLTLTVHERPEFEVVQSDILCLDGDEITLETFNANGNFNYEWKDETGLLVGTFPQLTLAHSGEYTVTATSANGCISQTIVFSVLESAIADIDLEDLTIVDFSENNTIAINNSNNNLGVGDYEFSLNNEFGPYQDDPFFSQVPAGLHDLYIRDKKGCGIASIQIGISGFPRFFSPNNDGFNDTWNLKGWKDQFTEASRIYIYDRYGKFIKELTPWQNGWNGTFNGNELATTDFWFLAEMVEPSGTIRTLKGHFSLVR